ncbi:MAG: cysteine desulfurase family protein [Thermotogota bacterium]
MIYLDNNATTIMYEEVFKILQKYSLEIYSNPNSIHEFGVKADVAMEEARFKIAKMMGVMPYEIYFTSGATESINWAIKGTALSRKNEGKHILSSRVEHSATVNTLSYLKKQGFEIDYVKANKYGELDLEDLKEKIREDTILCTFMFSNNELGTINPVKKIQEIIKSKNENTLFHLDAVQALGKVDFRLKDFQCDMASFSAHKFHGPKGIGFLYKKESTLIHPLITGGTQERGQRGGTQNVPSIVAMAKALEISINDLKEMDRIKKLRDEIANEIKSFGAKIVTPLNNSIPNTVSTYFEGLRGDVIVNALSDEEIYISTSAACSSKGTSGSRVLKELGFSNRAAEGMIRISLSSLTTGDEVRKFINILKNVLGFLRF